MTKTDTLKRIAEVLRIQGKAWRTEEAYSGWAGRYIDWLKKHGPEGRSESKVEGFLTHLARDLDVSPSTQNQAFNALLFVYAEVWKQPLKEVDALRAKRPAYERTAPTPDETIALINAMEDTPDCPMKLITRLLYGCGLRVNEALDIRLKDVQFPSRIAPEKPGRIIVRAPKQGHDRTVPIPRTLLGEIRQQVDRALATCAFQMKRWPKVPLQIPFALARKYPRSAWSESWAFLFPGPRPVRHPRTNALNRWRIMDNTVQNAFRAACGRAGILSHITPHCMRHGFGTHFDGDIRDLQELLGHKSLETTMRYRHPEVDRSRSPLDVLALTGNLVPFENAAAFNSKAIVG